MSTSQPIRSTDELEAFRGFYLDKEPNLRNYAMICMGVNTALRIMYEKKTGKESRIALNGSIKSCLGKYMESLDYVKKGDYIFTGRYEGTHLSRSQAFRIIKHAAYVLNMEMGISCHSMRKTFGYCAWKCGTQPALLMDIYNHSSYEITKRYLGIKQDDRDSVFLKVNL